MVRIIPWKLPDVQGGSVGGYTPAPTPEPATNYPYDLTDFDPSITVAWKTGLGPTQLYDIPHTYSPGSAIKLYGFATASVNKVDILDTTEVAMVILTANYSGSIDCVLEDSSGHQSTKTVTVSSTNAQIDVSSCFGIGGSVTQKIVDGIYVDSLTKIVSADDTNFEISIVNVIVYNSNGIALQEWEAE